MKTFVIWHEKARRFVGVNRRPVPGQFEIEARQHGWQETRWVRDLVDAEKFYTRGTAERMAGRLLDFGWTIREIGSDARSVA